jgi:membrane protease YdiL (CAAX protease family)
MKAGFEFGKLTPVLFALLLATIYGWWMYRLSRRFALNELEIQLWQPLASELTLDEASEEARRERRHRQRREKDERRHQQWASANATLAIFGSAMLFGLMHCENWPAPIPLFGMGLVLGWLASRTQNLIGPITFHALFNLLNFIVLYGSVVNAPPPNGNALTTPVRPSVVGSMTTSIPTSLLPLRK